MINLLNGMRKFMQSLSQRIPFNNNMKKIPCHLALFLLKHDMINDDKGRLMCKDFANDDEDFVEIVPDDYESLNEDKSYTNFEIWLKDT